MKEIESLRKYIDNSPSMYHAVLRAEDRFVEEGYEKIELNEKWELSYGGKYYLIHNDSSIVAFELGDDLRRGYKIVGAHTDSPTFKIKPNALIKSNGYYSLNTEVYGGPILHTWFDRPLSLAGRAYVKGKNSFNPEVKYVDIDRDLFIIPNLAIHMSRGENLDDINPQKHTLPLLSLDKDQDFSIENLLAKELKIDEKDLLSYDLFIYAREKSSLLGLDEEFISVGKLDNLAMIHAGMEAILSSDKSNTSKVFVGFDNEEIGSATTQGADSGLLINILRKINFSLGLGEDDFITSIYNSFMISADQAHSVHPNYADKADPTNRPLMNKGIVIKESAKKSYATDAYGKAILIDLLKKLDIPYQEFVNRSDARGGSTIGPISESKTNIRNIDIGNALLSMHSVRELGGVEDQKHMINLLRGFYELNK